MASWILGPITGPIIGPIAGGYLTQNKDWRWSFWVVAIVVRLKQSGIQILDPSLTILTCRLAGAITILNFMFMRKTYAYALLQKKTRRLQKETGDTKPRSAVGRGQSTNELFKVAIVRPIKMLLFRLSYFRSFYMAIVYGYLYLIFTAQPVLFEEQYGFSAGEVGLSYIGLGVGSVFGVFFTGTAVDSLSRQLTKNNGGEAKPEYRLPVLVITSFIIPLGLFMYVWAAEKNEHCILPIIGTPFLGLGMICSLMGTSVYLVDAYVQYAASAVAASTVLRSLVGALLPLAGRKMYDALGYGWGTSLLAFITVAMIPVLDIFLKYGERIRKYNFFDVRA